uniref:Uncharacterized protein n=1 Tax=Rhizophora mucronata TaxID=61149 RepID=A0A2P2NK22_RHIMU
MHFKQDTTLLTTLTQ